MQYELKALEVGGILDQSIRILKEHFVLFLKIMLCLQIPINLAFQLLMIAMSPKVSAQPTPEEINAFMQAQTGLLVLLFPFILLTMLVVVPITNAAIVHATSRVYLGRPTNLADAFRAAFGRFLPLLWTWFLVYCFCLVGFMLCILPGILMLFRYGLAGNIAVVEGVSGMEALNRSKYLMTTERTKHYNQLFLLGLLLFVIGAGIGVISAFIPQAHIQAVVAVILQAVQGAFGLIATVVFYFSCRCRVENFDLMQLAAAVGETPAEQPTNLEQG